MLDARGDDVLAGDFAGEAPASSPAARARRLARFVASARRLVIASHPNYLGNPEHSWRRNAASRAPGCMCPSTPKSQPSASGTRLGCAQLGHEVTQGLGVIVGNGSLSRPARRDAVLVEANQLVHVERKGPNILQLGRIVELAGDPSLVPRHA